MSVRLAGVEDDQLAPALFFLRETVAKRLRNC
jgi:hypothetical protein